MTTKIRRSRKTLAAAPTASPAIDAPAAPATIETLANVSPVNAPVTAALDTAAPTIASMRRRNPTVAAFLAGDLTPSAPADTSIGATLRACGIDPMLGTVPGTSGVINVTPAAHGYSSAALDPAALDTVSMPYTRTPDAVRFAHTLTSAAVALLNANPAHALTNADASPFRTPADAHPLATLARTLYFRAMIVHPRCPATFTGNRVSPLDVVASLARAAARITGDDLPAVGNGAACRASVPVLHAAIAARVANLNA